jgi:X-X-X-Leu-X-X-Gly heptad repeat protein
MERSEIEQVLANWIAQATSGDGQLADGIDPAKWIATNFVKWWHPLVDDSLSDAEGAAHRVRDELNRLGGWENKELGEALHELIHVADALGDLRVALGLHNDDA